MKYFARIGANEYEVEINQDQILLDGEPISVDFFEGKGDIFLSDHCFYFSAFFFLLLSCSCLTKVVK